MRGGLFIGLVFMAVGALLLVAAVQGHIPGRSATTAPANNQQVPAPAPSGGGRTLRG